MAAAFASTTIGTCAAKPATPQINWNQWVDPSVTRLNLANPFTLDGFTYATDGRKLIRLQCDSKNETQANLKIPNVHQLPWDSFDSGGWKSLKYDKAKAKSEFVMCCQCCGLGRIGSDLAWKDNGDSDALFWDGKTGWIGGTECERCTGEGWLDSDFVNTIDGYCFDPGLMQPILNLGNVEYKLETNPDCIDRSSQKEKTVAMLFRFDSGIGLLAGRVQP